ncbi:MAG: GNAT family N-acetyltransferase [Gammaproteobacteria bacterium]
MIIDEVETRQLDEFSSLYANVFNQPPWKEGWSVEAAGERLSCYRETPNFVGVSARIDDCLVGFIFGNFEPYQDERLYVLKEMCVSPACQRTGVGSAMLTRLHQVLESLGVTTVNLLTRIDTSAEQFYLKSGYYKSEKMRLYVAKFNT